jgi:hypothetical protein
MREMQILAALGPGDNALNGSFGISISQKSPPTPMKFSRSRGFFNLESAFGKRLMGASWVKEQPWRLFPHAQTQLRIRG